MATTEQLSQTYRNDPQVPPFDESRPVFLFDGICVLCSTGVSFLMRRDRHGKVALASAQSALGRAIFGHYGIAIDTSYLLVADGRAYAKTDGFIRVAKELGGLWRATEIIRVIPRPIRDWFYDRLAANRYRLFGKSEYCQLLTPEQRARLIDR